MKREIERRGGGGEREEEKLLTRGKKRTFFCRILLLASVEIAPKVAFFSSSLHLSLSLLLTTVDHNGP